MAQRNVHCHLVTVEVGVEGRSYQGVKLDGFTFYQLGLESLDGKPVQRWGTVQHDRVTLENIFKYIPNNCFFFVHKFPCRLNSLHDASFNQFADDKWLEQFSSHILGKTALEKFQLRSNHDHRTAR